MEAMALSNSHSAARIATAQREINDLDSRIELLKIEIEQLRESDNHVATKFKTANVAPPLDDSSLFTPGPLTRVPGVNRHSAWREDCAVPLSLFAGRSDVSATRWVSAKTEKRGWSPAVRGGFYTDAVTDSDFAPFTEQVVDQHLRGTRPIGADFPAGLYPMTSNDICRLLMCDFDDGEWRADAFAYVTACSQHGARAAAEISRSGDGAHVWIFLSDAVPASLARSLGSSLLREAMDIRGALTLSSYDRFFLSQDFLPRKSPGRMRLGNLIALPSQGVCRTNGTTVFADPADWIPDDDQFAYLSGLTSMSFDEVSSLVSNLRPVLTGPSASIATDQRRSPWREKEPVAANTPRPERVKITIGSVIAIPTVGLPTALIAELEHVASLSNPEFFPRQAQRFSTFDTPRYVYCFEHDDTHLRLPRGLLDEVVRAMGSAKIAVDITNTIPKPHSIALTFRGTVTTAQHDAVEAMLGLARGAGPQRVDEGMHVPAPEDPVKRSRRSLSRSAQSSWGEGLRSATAARRSAHAPRCRCAAWRRSAGRSGRRRAAP